MTEARYRGQKVVVCSPDYSDTTKFADEWLRPAPGTDGALAMAMGHVILKDSSSTAPPRSSRTTSSASPTCRSSSRSRSATASLPGRFLTAHDLGETDEHSEFKTVLLDAFTGQPVVPNGSLGFRFGQQGAGRWNLDSATSTRS